MGVTQLNFERSWTSSPLKVAWAAQWLRVRFFEVTFDHNPEKLSRSSSSTPQVSCWKNSPLYCEPPFLKWNLVQNFGVSEIASGVDFRGWGIRETCFYAVSRLFRAWLGLFFIAFQVSKNHRLGAFLVGQKWPFWGLFAMSEGNLGLRQVPCPN